MSTLLGTVPTYPCFILYIVSKWDQTNDIHLTRLSTYGGLSTVMKKILTENSIYLYSKSTYSHQNGQKLSTVSLCKIATVLGRLHRHGIAEDICSHEKIRIHIMTMEVNHTTLCFSTTAVCNRQTDGHKTDSSIMCFKRA